jgi:hypothetical protein
MVAKISSGTSLYSVLAYNQQKVNEEKAKVLFSHRMIEPLEQSNSIGVYTHSFEPYLLANKKTEKPIMHISLNPDPKDVLTNEQLSEIAQEYMQKLGYGNQPFIIYKHEDIDRHHLHIVSVRVDENGKKLDHNFEHRRSMDICRELELKYKLLPADKKQRKEALPLKAVHYEEGEIKHQITNVIRPVARSWHFQNFREYKTLLSLYNIHAEEIKGEHKGQLYNGVVYSVLNDKGKKIGSPIKSSVFGKSVGYGALYKRMEKSGEIINNRKLKERSKKIITQFMQSCKNRNEFKKELSRQGISVLFRENESGRIYGVTFIDHRQKVVFNGSRLGKAFSANIFQEKFNTQQDGKSESSDNTHSSEIHQKYDTNKVSSTENLFDVFSIENHGDNPEEEAFIRKMKRRKKRKR